MKNQWRLYLSLFFVFIIVIFAILNNQLVSINYGFGEFKAPLVLIIFGSTLIGAVIVSLMVTTTTWRQKKEIKNLKKEITNFHERFEAFEVGNEENKEDILPHVNLGQEDELYENNEV